MPALNRMTGREVKETATMALPSQPFQIMLKQVQPIQTIFTFYRDRTLSGLDYPPGDNL